MNQLCDQLIYSKGTKRIDTKNSIEKKRSFKKSQLAIALREPQLFLKVWAVASKQHNYDKHSCHDYKSYNLDEVEIFSLPDSAKANHLHLSSSTV